MPDPEVAAMSTVADTLASLEEDARGRVLRWAAERFGVSLSASNSDVRRSAPGTRPLTDDFGSVHEETSHEDQAFEHFAELFNASNPKTNDDKALVAGYWFQAIKGNDKFKATELQTELKNLGHAVPNITDSLSGNIKKKPARILQLAKAGSSQQARKTYKLTHEGIKAVHAMMAPIDPA